ncbi:hypothetical protein EVAR_32762_1 [Eumeta japonica]|uniref:Uncharacterized protein n=1 Tax=Eumeta variegata TaxID=151549 RepID=A0A4C1WEZ7_EUMVA|nr:hypothetical protein EVAR_32762_1 [Eumeta japonica]
MVDAKGEIGEEDAFRSLRIAKIERLRKEIFRDGARTLKENKNVNGRSDRWALRLQEYDFKIVYTWRRLNVVADFLSIHSLKENNDLKSVEEEIELAVYRIAVRILVEKQSSDELCGFSVEALERNKDNEIFEVIILLGRYEKIMTVNFYRGDMKTIA